MFWPAPAIVNEVLLDERIDENPCPSLPKPENMARAANRLRQQLRPEDPTDLAFEISEENIPDDFLKADVCIQSKRHLVLPTSQQLQQLVKAKNWYVDRTFKLCSQPFSQLFTINAFVKSGDQAKQVPPPVCHHVVEEKAKLPCRTARGAEHTSLATSCEKNNVRLRVCSVDSPQAVATRRLSTRMPVPLDANVVEKGRHQ